MISREVLIKVVINSNNADEHVLIVSMSYMFDGNKVKLLPGGRPMTADAAATSTRADNVCMSGVARL